jgi:hypothetical protein
MDVLYERTLLIGGHGVQMATLVDLQRTKINVKRQTKFGSPKGTKPNQKVFQIETDGKHYTALSVGRDFTSQGRDNNLRNEKWEGTTHPPSPQ